MKNKKTDNILKDAINVVYDRSSEKAKEYGPFDESMASAAIIASELTGKEITTLDFYKCMMALKLARLKYSSKEDTFLDLVAYIGAAHKSVVETPACIKENSKIVRSIDKIINDKYTPNYSSNEFDKNQTND